MTPRPPDLRFWVMRAGGKKYDQIPVRESTDPVTGKVKWRRTQYLSDDSVEFEKCVRSSCAALNPEIYDWTRIIIELYYPISVNEKGKKLYPKQGRADCTNLQKSVEDAIQKQKVGWKLKRRRKICLDKLKVSEVNPMIKRAYWDDQLLLADAAIETFKRVEAFRGAVMKDDIGTHHITTLIRWRPPDTAKCVRVSVWEVQPEEYHTKELTEWLKSE